MIRSRISPTSSTTAFPLGPVRLDPAQHRKSTYDGELLESIPVYQLITTRKSHDDSQFIPDSTRRSGYGGSDYLWEGTLVYDGVVYDHIHFRARGGVWRYAMGKNMWKFDFNRGHSFQARDDYGQLVRHTMGQAEFLGHHPAGRLPASRRTRPVRIGRLQAVQSGGHRKPQYALRPFPDCRKCRRAGR